MNKLKNLLKFLFSRFYYLFIGIAFSIAFYAAYAAWNTTVSSNETLTNILWNDIVNHLVDITNRLNNKGYIDFSVAGGVTNITCPGGSRSTFTLPTPPQAGVKGAILNFSKNNNNEEVATIYSAGGVLYGELFGTLDWRRSGSNACSAFHMSHTGGTVIIPIDSSGSFSCQGSNGDLPIRVILTGYIY